EQKAILDRESARRAEAAAEDAWIRVQRLTHELDALRDVVKQAEQRCSTLQQERDALEARLADSENCAKAAAEESGAFFSQLRPVQEELEKHHLNIAAVKTVHAEPERQLNPALTAQ